VSQDRLKQAFRDLQRLDPMLPYRRLYRAKLLAQDADLQHVDVRPFDSGVPDMAGIELRHGIPGVKVQVALGCTLQVGWDDGKPDKPFAALWSTDAHAVKIVMPSDQLLLGSEAAIQQAPLGTLQRLTLETVLDLVAVALGPSSLQLTAIDGGAACIAAVAAISAAKAVPYLSNTVKIAP
jgi:hypothetical protein